MARTPASLPGGLRLSDYLSVGVIARVFPRTAVREALRRTERESVRRRSLPAEVMMYYVIAMSLFRQASTREVLRCLMEGLRWVSPELLVRVSGKSSISRARSRLGPQPFAALREACVRPLAAPSTAGAWYRGRRVVAIDGSSLSVPDEEANRRHFGLPGASRGQAGYPKLRLSVLMELGTRAPLAWCGGPVVGIGDGTGRTAGAASRARHADACRPVLRRLSVMVTGSGPWRRPPLAGEVEPSPFPCAGASPTAPGRALSMAVAGTAAGSAAAVRCGWCATRCPAARSPSP